MRQALYLVVILLFLGAANMRVEVQAIALKNRGMLSLLRTVTSVQGRHYPAHEAIWFLERSIDHNPSLPRVKTTIDWLYTYKTRIDLTLDNKRQADSIKVSWSISEQRAFLENQLVEAAYDGWVEAQLALASLYQEQEREAALIEAVEQLSNWEPMHENWASFNWEGWQLEGYEWRPLSTTWHSDVYLVLFWRRTQDYQPEQTLSLNSDRGLYLVNNRLFQVIRGRNLLANGDFEWLHFQEVTSVPPGFRLMFHDQDLGEAAYRTERIDQNSNLMVTNVLGEIVLYVYPPEIKNGNLYLVLGRMKSNGSGYYGMREFIDGKNRFTMAANRLNELQWASSAILFRPSSENTGGIFFLFGVRDNSAEYEAYASFDDLGVFEIDSPPF